MSEGLYNILLFLCEFFGYILGLVWGFRVLLLFYLIWNIYYDYSSRGNTLDMTCIPTQWHGTVGTDHEFMMLIFMRNQA